MIAGILSGWVRGIAGNRPVIGAIFREEAIGGHEYTLAVEDRPRDRPASSRAARSGDRGSAAKAPREPRVLGAPTRRESETDRRETAEVPACAGDRSKVGMSP